MICKAPDFLIHDSSPQFLSNVTFGTSFAFQMREEYILDFFFKLDLKGVFCSFTRSIFLDIFELCKKYKKKSKIFLYFFSIGVFIYVYK